jgi:ribosomal protein S18 acetylase RimI-like enzyme
MLSTSSFHLTSQQNKVIIRKATSNDIDAIAQVMKCTFPHTYVDPATKEKIFPESEVDEICAKIQTEYPLLLNDIKSCILVAELNHHVVGFCKLILEADYVFLDRLYVLPQYQDKKIGIDLLKSSMRYAISVNINQMNLQVWHQNGKAIRFYLDNSFVIKSMHDKTTSDGKVSSGFDLECDDLQVALSRLNTYSISSRNQRARL